MNNSDCALSFSSNTQSTIDEENIRLIHLCNQKLETDPTSKKALLLRANIYIKLNHYTEAKTDLHSLLSETILAPTIYYLLGFISKQEENLTESITYLSKAIELDSNNVNALFLRGAILNMQGKFNEAINDYSLALEKDSLKATKTNIYKNIEKILDLDKSSEDNNDSISTNQNESFSNNVKEIKIETQTNKSNTIDDEINRNLHFILRRDSDITPRTLMNRDMCKGRVMQSKWQTSKELNKGKEKEKYKDSEVLLVLSTPNNACKYLNINTDISEDKKYLHNNNNNDMPITSSTKSKGNNKTKHSINDVCDNLFSSYQLETESSIPISPRKPQYNSSSNNNKYLQCHSSSKGKGTLTNKNLKKYINISLCHSQHSSSSDDDDNDNNKQINNENKSEQLYNQGLLYRKKGKFSHALDLFNKVLQLTPNHFKSLFNKAFCLDKMQNYNESITTYTKAIQINNTYPYTFYNRGIVYDKIGNFQQSISDFSKAIELYPTKKEFYYNRAFSYKKINNYSKAINDFNKYLLLLKHNNDFNALFNRGICYEKITSYSKAICDFEQCIQLNPNMIPPLYHLANIHYKTNSYLNSINYFNKIIEINPKYAPAYHGLGLINEKDKNYIMAIEYFTRAININSTNSAYYYNRACVYQAIGIISQAINDLNEAIKLDKDNVMFYEDRAYLYAKNKEYKLAVDDYDFILEVETCNETAMKNREYCLSKLYQHVYE